jgi:hypothetical protein
MAAQPDVTVARLDRLPASRRTRRLVTLLSLGGWLEFYDLFFTAYVAPGLKAGFMAKNSIKSAIFRPVSNLVSNSDAAANHCPCRYRTPRRSAAAIRFRCEILTSANP